MELIERAEFLVSLQSHFEKTVEGEGHCVFICGEAGIGKTSLVRSFCNEHKEDCAIYTGTCDALFTPRPLAPLFDIAQQIGGDLWVKGKNIDDRADLFMRFFRELSNQKKQVILVFEDIHWADEATLDFIKFFARRISSTSCLFLLTYRDNEIHSRHPLRHVMGQLVPGSFSRIQLIPFSRETVEKLSKEKGYKGEDVYSISGGNPFYVNEILASYSPGVPANIKDSILFVYNVQEEKVKQIWSTLSVLPTGLEVKYLEELESQYENSIENCLRGGVLVIKDGLILFKHELYRRTIEESMSPLCRITLNKTILDQFTKCFEKNNQIERIIHHAKNANAYDLVVKYAPIAARQAALLGAHIESSKLYFSAIEYYQGNDPEVLLPFYESYAYECYLTSQIKEAIIYQGKVLNIRKEQNDIKKVGDSLRFLSRLWWFEGNRTQSEKFAVQAVELLDKEPSSKEKAMAYSNMAQLKMLSEQIDECLYWGEKAAAIARELNDDDVLSHALNNIGAAQIGSTPTEEKGFEILQESLAIALKNNYDEHAGRAYTNLASMRVITKRYAAARTLLEEGIRYCEERNLNAWSNYMISFKARLELETGHWEEAYNIAARLSEDETQPLVVRISAMPVIATVKMRKGDANALPLLLEIKAKAFDMMEYMRIIPAMTDLLEYEWITGNKVIDERSLQYTIDLVGETKNIFGNSEFAFWLWKARKQQLSLKEVYAGYDVSDEQACRCAISLWDKLGSSFEKALILFEGNEEDKRKAITIVHELGADSVYEKMKQEMRASGIRKIPRGIRETTRSNPAQLTNRELDILQLLKQTLQNKEIASKLFISAKTVDHHISSILFKLDVNSRGKAVEEAIKLGVIV